MTVKRENLVELQGKLYQKCKVHMLPTDGKRYADIKIGKHGMFTNAEVGSQKYMNNEPIKHYHLYFTSDEEIKKGDWYLYKDEIHQCQVGHTVTKYPKIIATTDTSLKVSRKNANINQVWKLDGALLPQLSQDFIIKYIEEYNKDNVITDVLVELELNIEKGSEKFLEYKAECVRCVWEEDYRLKIDKNNTITIKKVKDSWNREEVERLLQLALATGGAYGMKMDQKNANSWIEENL